MAIHLYPIKKPFASFYCQPVAKTGIDEYGKDIISVVTADEADFYSVYSINLDGTSQCIADTDTAKESEEVKAFLISVVLNS